jgi:hypothetical protein
MRGCFSDDLLTVDGDVRAERLGPREQHTEVVARHGPGPWAMGVTEGRLTDLHL